MYSSLALSIYPISMTSVIINTLLLCPLQLTSADLLVLNLLHATIEVSGPSGKVTNPVGSDSGKRGESSVQGLDDLSSLAVGNVVNDDLGEVLRLNDGGEELGGGGQIGKESSVHLAGAHKSGTDNTGKTLLVGDGVVETDNGVLRGGVSRHVTGANETDGGGDGHDPSSLVLEEVGDDGLEGPEVRDNVDLEQVSNELLAKVLDSLLAHHTGVVNEDGNGAHVPLDLSKGLVDNGLIGKVAEVVGGAGEGSGGLLSVEDGHTDTSLGELVGNVVTETVGATGDDSNVSRSELPALDLQVSSRDDSEEVENGNEDACAGKTSKSGQVLVEVAVLVGPGNDSSRKQRAEEDLVCQLDNVVNVEGGLCLVELIFVSEFGHDVRFFLLGGVVVRKMYYGFSDSSGDRYIYTPH